MTEPEQLRILLVTRNLPPLVGGMERLNWHLADELSRHGQVRVIAPQGSGALAPAGVEVVEVPLRPLWKFLWLAQWRALRVARRWRPDVILAGSGLTALPALLAARTSGARAAVYVHGLDLTVPHLIYRSLWRPALRRMDRVIANSRATATLAGNIGVECKRIGMVHPGVALPARLPDEAALVRLRRQHQLGQRPLLLSVGRLSVRKGLREFVTEVLPRIVATRPDVLLLIVGDAPCDALHAQAQTPESIRAAAIQAGVSDNIRFLGVITDYDKLGEFYSVACIHVFPVRDLPGDPEGFGMVAVEAAAHGLPTVAYAVGGVVDAVKDGFSGYLVDADDPNAFADSVLCALASKGALRKNCIDHAQCFSWPVFGAKMDDQLSSMSNAPATRGRHR